MSTDTPTHNTHDDLKNKSRKDSDANADKSKKYQLDTNSPDKQDNNTVHTNASYRKVNIKVELETPKSNQSTSCNGSFIALPIKEEPSRIKVELETHEDTAKEYYYNTYDKIGHNPRYTDASMQPVPSSSANSSSDHTEYAQHESDSDNSRTSYVSIAIDIKDEPLRIYNTTCDRVRHIEDYNIADKPEVVKVESVTNDLDQSTSNAAYNSDTKLLKTDFTHHPGYTQISPAAYQCDICHKQFTHSELQQHMRTHVKQNSLESEVCADDGMQPNIQPLPSSAANLSSNLRDYTQYDRDSDNSVDIDIKDEPLQIKTDIEQGQCNRTAAPDSIHDTENESTKEKLNECDICHKDCIDTGRLKRHMRTHTGEKPYECDICHKQFDRKDNLNVHMRTHTGEKPYDCDICHKQFAHKGKANAHIRSHTGGKPLECDICCKRFHRRDHLNVHMRIHTGEKPFTCDTCHKQFSQKTSLTIHVRTHTRKQP